MSCWVGIDPGERRIGLARSDTLGMLATPRGVVGNQDLLLSWLQEIDDEHQLKGIIVGLPRNMRGSYGPMARRSMQLADWLRERVGVPVYLWDERLTTRQARATGSKGGIDERAAAIILQSYLDAGTPTVEDPAPFEEEPPAIDAK
ncbi:MAG TPA: Holliday junction resolvase RuvX [Planctomycetes bacterium]|nr:Holliday junction resolvase RuvX [Planctomycetota bacterium]HIN80826.1 Holliday junction resolvase RuvX [Planctomycetota bacterium]